MSPNEDLPDGLDDKCKQMIGDFWEAALERVKLVAEGSQEVRRPATARLMHGATVWRSSLSTNRSGTDQEPGDSRGMQSSAVARSGSPG